MPANIVLGAQWGDEGKGKAIDQLAPNSTWAVRFQGGNNAGHTIVLGDTTLKLHQIPSGVTSMECNSSWRWYGDRPLGSGRRA